MHFALRYFCNKLFNATRYVLMNTEGMDPSDVPQSRNTIDRWIIGRLQQTELAVTQHMGEYRFDLAATALYEFIWNEYCDWYLEMAKPVLTGDHSEESKQATRITLVRVLEATLRLTHPVMPYITEELWQQIAPLAGKSGPSISLQPWPLADSSVIDEQAVEEIEWVKRVVMGVRRIRSEMNINPGKRLPLLASDTQDLDRQRLQTHAALLSFLARLDSIEPMEPGTNEPDAAITLVDHMRLLIPMAGLIDKDAELARLAKEIKRLTGEVARLQGKLSNEGFTAKAPAAVIEGEQRKLDDARAALEQMQEQSRRIEALEE